MKKLIATALVSFSLVGSLGLAACASSASASSSSTSESTSMQEPSDTAASLESVGKEAADGASFEFTNKLGKDITAIAVKQSGAEAYPASLLGQGEVIKSGETVVLNCPEVRAASQEDVAVKPLADISITLSDGTVMELHQVSVYDIESAAVRAEGTVAYLEFTAEGSASTESTLESEKAIAQQKADEEAARAAAEAEAAAQAQAEQAQAEAQPVADQQYYDAGDAYEEPAVDDSAVGGGSEEACIDDIVLR